MSDTDRHTYTQTDSLTDRQTQIQTNKAAQWQHYELVCGNSLTDSQTTRQTDRQTKRQTDGQRLWDQHSETCLSALMSLAKNCWIRSSPTRELGLCLYQSRCSHTPSSYQSNSNDIRITISISTAGRLVCHAMKADHITSVLKDLHWLRIQGRIQYKLCVLAFNCQYSLAPPYLSDQLQQVARME